MKNLFSVNFIPDDIPSYLCQPETNSILALKMDMVNMNNISVENRGVEKSILVL